MYVCLNQLFRWRCWKEFLGSCSISSPASPSIVKRSALETVVSTIKKVRRLYWFNHFRRYPCLILICFPCIWLATVSLYLILNFTAESTEKNLIGTKLGSALGRDSYIIFFTVSMWWAFPKIDPPSWSHIHQSWVVTLHLASAEEEVIHGEPYVDSTGVSCVENWTSRTFYRICFWPHWTTWSSFEQNQKIVS